MLFIAGKNSVLLWVRASETTTEYYLELALAKLIFLCKCQAFSLNISEQGKVYMRYNLYAEILFDIFRVWFSSSVVPSVGFFCIFSFSCRKSRMLPNRKPPSSITSFLGSFRCTLPFICCVYDSCKLSTRCMVKMDNTYLPFQNNCILTIGRILFRNPFLEDILSKLHIGSVATD